MEFISLSLNLLFAILMWQLALIAAQGPSFSQVVCSKDRGNFTSTSTYSTNLNKLINAISSNTKMDNGFLKLSVGQNSDRVYGIGQCYGANIYQTSSCRSCLDQASKRLAGECPTQKEAIGYYAGSCMVRYSDRAIFGIKETNPSCLAPGLSSLVGVDVKKLNQTFAALLERLRNRAAAGDSGHKFATDAINVTASMKIYGLTLCDPDLSVSDCSSCLEEQIKQVKVFWNEGAAGGVYAPTCSVDFESYPFLQSANRISSSPIPSLIGPSSDPGKGRGKRKTLIIVVILFLLFMLFPTLVFCFSRRRMRKLHKEVESNDQIKCVDSLQFDFNTIQASTDNFSDTRRIGEGSSAIVFRGVLPSGQEVAVKRLHKLGKDGEAKFNNEVLLSANLQHKNLVKFIGFCVRKDLRFLIYEFVPNGSLDWFFYDPIKHTNLDWGTRWKIIQGIARGLLYLHEDSQVRVIHRDLKPSNIFLSVGMNPKISNFCKSTLVHEDHTRGSTSTIKGTFGYMPPEYALQGNFSLKSDVFSFGVILLEIISGQMINRFSDEENNESLPIIAWRKWSEGKAMDIVDQTMSNIQNHAAQILRCIKIALLCVQENPSYRPTMSIVVLMLNSNTVPIPEPSKPGFKVQDELIQSFNHCSSQIERSYRESVNEASMSDFEPR